MNPPFKYTSGNIKKWLVGGLLPLLFPFWASAQLLYPPAVGFSPEGGFFPKGSVEVKLNSLIAEEVDIHYTTDGSEPNRQSEKYRNPIRIRETTVIRAIAYKKNGRKSRIEASTYFVDEPPTDWAVVSLAVKPEMLFDSIHGLFQKGIYNEVHGAGNYGANYWDRREHFMNAEIFEQDSGCVYRSPCGFRLFGGVSRTFPQKSILMISRLRYGDKRIKHQLFPEEKLDKFKFIILRNAGSDWGKAHGRDVVIGKMVDDWGLDKQASRPCHVYINGQYWGVYYLREKINSYYIASHHKEVHPDTVDLIEHRQAVRKGSGESYFAMLKFMEQEDMRLPANYEFLKSLMDVTNYADYKLLQIFIDNGDAGGNIKFWRSRNADERWRWILYDTDWGFGLMKGDAFKANSLGFHTAEDGPEWPNPPWSTFILRKLLENPEFEALFVNRFCDRLNTSFLSDSMLAHINRHHALMAPQMPRQFKRWRTSSKVWEGHYDRMRQFAKRRPTIVWKQLIDRFEPGTRVRVELEAEGRGRVMLNDNLKISYVRPFMGFYFEKYPITLHAIPRLGYTFSHWEGTDIKTPHITVDLMGKRKVRYKAVFVPLTTELENRVLFNEVSCYNHQTGDWLEIHNNTKEPVDVTGWIIKNKKKEYYLPQYQIPAEGYIIVARSKLNFLRAFPMHDKHTIGDFDFGLDKRSDRLELYTDRGATVDTFSYEIATPGRAFTIDLKDPDMDNGNRGNWEVRMGLGTPASHNPSYLGILAHEAQMRWLRNGLLAGVLLVGLIGFLVFRKR